MGSGVVGLPLALAQMSWWGCLVLVLMALVQTWTCLLLFKVQEKYPNANTYIEIGEAVYGRWGKVVIAIITMINNLGTAALYLILAGDNMGQMTGILNSRTWTAIATLVILPFEFIRSMDDVAAFSVFGIVAFLLVIVVVTWQSVDFATKDTHNWTDYKSEFNLTRFFGALATFAFSYAPHTVLPEMVKDVPQPKTKTGMKAVLYAMPTCTVLYLIVMVASYYSYGCYLTGNVLLSPFFPMDAKWYVATAGITFNVLISCLLFTNGSFYWMETQFGIDSLEKEESAATLPPRDCKQHAMSIGLRTGVMVLLLLLAVFLPFFEQFLVLMGGLVMLQSLCLPVMMYFKVTDQNDTNIATKIIGYIIVVFGFLSFAFVTVTSIMDMYTLSTDVQPDPNATAADMFTVCADDAADIFKSMYDVYGIV